MQDRNMVVLDLIAVGRLFMSTLLITFVLTGCSEKSKQDINVLIDKFSHADETIIKFETLIATKDLSGFVSTGNGVVKLHGRINDSKELENIIDVSKGLANHLAPSMKSVVFRLDSEDKPMPIYFTIYIEGLCMALYTCFETHYVYFPNGDFQERRIDEEKYKYTELDRQNWYILQVRN